MGLFHDESDDVTQTVDGDKLAQLVREFFDDTKPVFGQFRQAQQVHECQHIMKRLYAKISDFQRAAAKLGACDSPPPKN